MATRLTQISIRTEEDLLRVHELALQIAEWAGLPVRDRLRFAAGVAAHCFELTGTNQLAFCIDSRNGRFILTADINTLPVVERELTGDMQGQTFQEPKPDRQWEKGYRDMQQFTFAMAHDLKNSLTKLKLALSLLEEEEIPESINHYVQIIHRAAARLEAIMVSLNKVIQVGDSSPDVVSTLSPAVIFADAQEEFADTLSKSGAGVTTDFTLVSGLNYIDVFLKSIFSNLLSNAIKYSSPQRPLEVIVSARRHGGKTVFTFSDNGQGIDLKVCGDKLFMPFTRFSNNTDGSGIGLYLVKNIVERNGGKIEIESTPEQGTTFRLFLQEYPLPSDSVAG